MFTLTFETDNAAFDGAENLMIETVGMLREVARRIRNGEYEGKCTDPNGNTIGSYRLDNK